MPLSERALRHPAELTMLPDSHYGDSSMKRRVGGFTLIELAIVMVIVAILAAIALPSYTRYVVRGNRSAAQSYMTDLAGREQQYLLDNRSYANQATIFLSDPVPSNVSKFYGVTVATPAGNPPRFTITATPVAGTMQASDGTLTLTESGAKSQGSSSDWH
jgi:type IV pilus assembly protein PilE